jgi:signal transduction histidine kinase
MTKESKETAGFLRLFCRVFSAALARNLRPRRGSKANLKLGMKKKLAQIKAVLGAAPTFQMLVSFGIALLLAAVALNVDLYRVEAYFYDLRMRWKGAESPHPDLVLLSMGDENNDASYSLEAHIKVLERLLKQKPKAILYMNKFDPTEVEIRPAAAERFVELALDAEEQGTRIYLGTEVDLSGEVLPPYPLSLLPHSPSILHKDGTMFGEDRVMRRALLTVFEEPSLHLRAAYPELSADELREKAQSVRGAYFYEPAGSWHVLTRYPDNTSVARGLYPRLRFTDILQGEDVATASGKIILVETLRRDAMNDYGYTPFSRVIYTNPRLVVHAAILDTILKDRGMVAVSNRVNAALTFLLALFLAFIAITMRPSRGVIALAILSGGLFLVSLALFRWGLWLPLVPPLLAMFFTYYLIVPYRAILEYKKRWEVQEKHDLLVQIEEMKGNFLSLMSHDLKTPVARIQGLAELVIRQGSLLPQQEEEMRQIIASTESLDKFISKILNLTRVESNEIKLNKRSKDVNKLLEQCVQKLDFQARQKGIRMNLALDPLFPIQVDAALIIQVFTNIIDNAIKYSPAGAEVRIISREVGDYVEVVIEDAGPGLDEDEKQQLFTKFFRGKSHPGDQTKGSGLGLYLSKYFIELHSGHVDAESQKGSGSRFLIQLPIQGGSA